ncbi:MAG TPA: D-glucuronyl C5-epimerase family protein [Thermoleophilaceae bacterium]|nr:D-glucuronyl C5-epimerase family protein [Thermoleophilaceae bacterium]
MPGPRPRDEIPLRYVRTGSRLPAPVELVLNAVLSRGAGYEPVPAGSAWDDSSVRGYYIDYSAKTGSPAFRDPARLNAVDLIQLGLAWHERELAGDASARDRFIGVCKLVEDRAEPAGDELRWWIRYPVPKYRVPPPWCSALSQGQAASLFVRAHLATGDDRYAELAIRAAAPLLSEHGSDLVTHTGAGPVLQEYPSDPPSHVLNGWISALWGLWDVRLGLTDARADAATTATLACLVANLDAYDTGWWTRYSLYPFALQDLAKPIYQTFHVAQLRVLHGLTGDDRIRTVAERWAGYDRPAPRLAALGQKALFAAADFPRRRRWSPDAPA